MTKERMQATREECRAGRAATSTIFDAIDVLLYHGHVAVAKDSLAKLRAVVDQMWTDAEHFAPETRTQ